MHHSHHYTDTNNHSRGGEGEKRAQVLPPSLLIIRMCFCSPCTEYAYPIHLRRTSSSKSNHLRTNAATHTLHSPPSLLFLFNFPYSDANELMHHSHHYTDTNNHSRGGEKRAQVLPPSLLIIRMCFCSPCTEYAYPIHLRRTSSSKSNHLRTNAATHTLHSPPPPSLLFLFNFPYSDANELMHHVTAACRLGRFVRFLVVSLIIIQTQTTTLSGGRKEHRCYRHLFLSFGCVSAARALNMLIQYICGGQSHHYTDTNNHSRGGEGEKRAQVLPPSLLIIRMCFCSPCTEYAYPIHLRRTSSSKSNHLRTNAATHTLHSPPSLLFLFNFPYSDANELMHHSHHYTDTNNHSRGGEGEKRAQVLPPSLLIIRMCFCSPCTEYAYPIHLRRTSSSKSNHLRTNAATHTLHSPPHLLSLSTFSPPLTLLCLRKISISFHAGEGLACSPHSEYADVALMEWGYIFGVPPSPTSTPSSSGGKERLRLDSFISHPLLSVSPSLPKKKLSKKEPEIQSDWDKRNRKSKEKVQSLECLRRTTRITRPTGVRETPCCVYVYVYVSTGAAAKGAQMNRIRGNAKEDKRTGRERETTDIDGIDGQKQREKEDVVIHCKEEKGDEEMGNNKNKIISCRKKKDSEQGCHSLLQTQTAVRVSGSLRTIHLSICFSLFSPQHYKLRVNTGNQRHFAPSHCSGTLYIYISPTSCFAGPPPSVFNSLLASPSMRMGCSSCVSRCTLSITPHLSNLSERQKEARAALPSPLLEST
eukprot:gene3837-2717_t